MTKRNFFTLLMLALLFITPGVTALVYFKHPEWLVAASTNKGRLLNPPILFEELTLGKKWHFILWYPNDCDMACLKTVDKLGRVRLALGRRLYDVEQWLVLKDNSQGISSLERDLQQQDIKVLSLNSKELDKYHVLDNKPELFIANPEGYLVLAYKKSVNPKDIYQDIKHLLSNNVNKSS